MPKHSLVISAAFFLLIPAFVFAGNLAEQRNEILAESFNLKNRATEAFLKVQKQTNSRKTGVKEDIASIQKDLENIALLKKELKDKSELSSFGPTVRTAIQASASTTKDLHDFQIDEQLSFAQRKIQTVVSKLGVLDVENVANTTDVQKIVEDVKKSVELENTSKKMDQLLIAENELKGSKWGFGINIAKFNKAEIKNVTASGSTLINNRASEYSTGLVLESHFWLNGPDLSLKDAKEPQMADKEATQLLSKPLTANGPFVALKVGNNENFELDSFTIGWMWGFKRRATDFGTWNIGAGFHVDTKFTTEAYLDSNKQIVLKEGDAKGWAIVLGATF